MLLPPIAWWLKPLNEERPENRIGLQVSNWVIGRTEQGFGIAELKFCSTGLALVPWPSCHFVSLTLLLPSYLHPTLNSDYQLQTQLLPSTLFPDLLPPFSCPGVLGLRRTVLFFFDPLSAAGGPEPYTDSQPIPVANTLG